MSDYHFRTREGVIPNHLAGAPAGQDAPWVLYRPQDLVRSEILSGLSKQFDQVRDKMQGQRNKSAQLDFLDQMLMFRFGTRAQVLAFFKDVLGFDPDQADQANGANHGNRIKEFVGRVEALMPEYVNLLLTIGDQSREAKARLDQMTGDFERVFGLIDELSASALGSALIGLNTQFDAARCGQAGQHHGFIADHICKISNRSLRFAREVDSEIQVAQQRVQGSRLVVDYFSNSDLGSTLALQSCIDQRLGRLKGSLASARGNEGDQWVLSDMQHTVFELQGILAIILLKVSMLQQLEVFSRAARDRMYALTQTLLGVLGTKIVF